MTQPIYLYDRSRVTTDWTCPRKRYWQYEWEGTGIVKASTSLELFTGTTIHDALALIAKFQKEGIAIDIDMIAQTAHDQMYNSLSQSMSGEVGGDEFAKEQAALIEGMLRGFYKQVWPRLMSQYPEILFIEEEMVYEHDGLIFMSKPDLVLKNGDDVVYVEYKTTKSKKEEWVNSWDTAVQLHSTVRAIKATTGVDVGSVIVQGLYKGYESYGKQSSPFCYAYRRNGNPPFTETETVYEYRAGFKRVPTWELEGGVKAWVEGMPDDVLGNQFLQTPPIFINEELVDSFFKQRAAREHEIASFFGNEDEDRIFPQKFDQCRPGYGRPCEYIKLCHGVSEDPLSQGFERRQPHHQLELERFNGLPTITHSLRGKLNETD